MSLVFTHVQISQLTELSKEGFATVPITNRYEVLRYKKDDTLLILYSSGKLVVQTSQAKENAVESYLATKGIIHKAKEKKASPPQDSSRTVQEIQALPALIGSDETLKGDTFGGLVVCGAYFTRGEIEQIRRVGIKDSKLLTKEQIGRIANELLALFPDHFAVEILTPKAYNSALEEQNITGLLNELHTRVADELHTRFGDDIPHLVDEYPGCVVGEYRLQKADQNFIVVGAASIVARYYALRQLLQLSAQAGFVLPKGSSDVQGALLRLIQEKKELSIFAKTSFSNVQKILDS